MSDEPRLILASGSPRRSELLARFGLPFFVHRPSVDEDAAAAEARVSATEPKDRQLVERAIAVASAKLQATVDDAQEDERIPRGVPVIAADTIVIDRFGSMLGKPSGAAELMRMLEGYSNSAITVVTGLAIAKTVADRSAAPEVLSVATRVHFGEITPEHKLRYLASGDGEDKAGGLSLQGSAGRFMTKVEGCWTNVVGLPLCATRVGIGRVGLEIEAVCRDRFEQPCICERADSGEST